MSELLTHFDPDLWSQWSASAFLIAFFVLVCWVYWPSRKSSYDNSGKLPIDGE